MQISVKDKYGRLALLSPTQELIFARLRKTLGEGNRNPTVAEFEAECAKFDRALVWSDGHIFYLYQLTVDRRLVRVETKGEWELFLDADLAEAAAKYLSYKRGINICIDVSPNLHNTRDGKPAGQEMAATSVHHNGTFRQVSEAPYGQPT